jgi:type I site-specific restriction endonuclease
MDKKQLSERDICTKFITPALRQAGWDELRQLREEVSFTKGRIIVRGKIVKRGKAKRADYILYYKPNIPLAVIEAKDNHCGVGDGLQQALEYADTLQLPFVFSSNGDGFVFHDGTESGGPIEQNLTLDEFPSPATLWARYRTWKGLPPDADALVLQDYYSEGTERGPRYYQATAVNAAIEAIAKGQNRLLLVMATGTGKTYTAFQIIWRLWKAGRKKRILFLVDRNILANQTMVNDFRPFGSSMAKLSTSSKVIERDDGAVDKKRRIDTSYEVYLALYQAITPYKVVKVHIDRDVEGYRPEPGKVDREGKEVEDRIYNQKDFDRTLVIDDRTKLVAKKVSAFLKETDPFQKTIVFCVDTEHAARMRQALVNENADIVKDYPRYVMRITGNDKEGVEQLDSFIDPETKFPVIVTTSQLLSTGVDVQTCRVIALDREISSMTEFKQIVGRGTRIHEDTRKFYFTLIDFRKVTNLFADPDFDGEPVQIYEPGPDDPMAPPEHEPPPGGGDPIGPAEGDEGVTIDGPLGPWVGHDTDTTYRKTYVDGVSVSIVAERVEYLDSYGKLVTESLRDYGRRELRKRFTSLDEFLTRWKRAERKQVVIDELENAGLPLDALASEVGADLDPFDLICHVAYDQPPLTRRERAENVRKRDVFTKYGPQARAVLDALLQKYQDEGVTNLDDPRILQVTPFDTMGTPIQLIRQFGNRRDFERAVQELQTALYEGVA